MCDCLTRAAAGRPCCSTAHHWPRYKHSPGSCTAQSGYTSSGMSGGFKFPGGGQAGGGSAKKKRRTSQNTAVPVNNQPQPADMQVLLYSQQ